MKKYYLLPLLLTTSCFSATAETDVSLTHDFDLNTAYEIVPLTIKECYAISDPQSIQQIKNDFSGNNIIITNIKDIINFDSRDVPAIKDVSIELDEDNNVLFQADIGQVPQNSSSLELKSSITTNQLRDLLTNPSIEMCATIKENYNFIYSEPLHNVFSLHLEAGFDKIP
jgi:hypothetical protein